MLADAGILVTPGQFYGPQGERHVRVSLTATDQHIDTASERLRSLKPAAAADLAESGWTHCPSGPHRAPGRHGRLAGATLVGW